MQKGEEAWTGGHVEEDHEFLVPLFQKKLSIFALFIADLSGI